MSSMWKKPYIQGGEEMSKEPKVRHVKSKKEEKDPFGMNRPAKKGRVVKDRALRWPERGK